MEIARPGFHVYLTIGYPEPGVFSEVLGALRGCCDFFELGLPSRRPRYDGPVVRGTHRAVVERGLVGLEALRLVDGVEGFMLMGYLGDYGGGLRGLLEASASAGASCVLLPDLLFEYPERVEEYVEESERAGLGKCFFVSSRFPHGWMLRLRGYRPLLVYLGLQPATGVRLPVAVERNIRLARRLLGDTYLLVGFALRTPSDAVAALRAGADGVVVGSEIARRLADGGVGAARDYACSMHRAVHGGV